MLTSDAEELSSKHLQFCLVEVAAGDSKMVEQILVNESDYRVSQKKQGFVFRGHFWGLNGLKSKS